MNTVITLYFKSTKSKFADKIRYPHDFQTEKHTTKVFMVGFQIERRHIKLQTFKGQMISKGFLVPLDSSKKRTKEFVFFGLTVLKTNLFLHFLEKFEDTKKSF